MSVRWPGHDDERIGITDGRWKILKIPTYPDYGEELGKGKTSRITRRIGSQVPGKHRTEVLATSKVAILEGYRIRRVAFGTVVAAHTIADPIDVVRCFETRNSELPRESLDGRELPVGFGRGPSVRLFAGNISRALEHRCDRGIRITHLVQGRAHVGFGHRLRARSVLACRF